MSLIPFLLKGRQSQRILKNIRGCRLCFMKAKFVGMELPSKHSSNKLQGAVALASPLFTSPLIPSNFDAPFYCTAVNLLLIYPIWSMIVITLLPESNLYRTFITPQTIWAYVEITFSGFNGTANFCAYIFWMKFWWVHRGNDEFNAHSRLPDMWCCSHCDILTSFTKPIN